MKKRYQTPGPILPKLLVHVITRLSDEQMKKLMQAWDRLKKAGWKPLLGRGRN